MATPPIPPNPVSSAIPQPGVERATVPQQTVGHSTVSTVPTVPTVPTYAQPIPKKASNSVVKVILASAGVLLLLVLVVVGYIGYEASKAIRQGTVASGELNPADLGVAEYPGSVRSTRKGATIKMNIPGGTSVIAAQYTSSAPPDRVVDFYKRELGSAAGVTSLGDRTSLTVARDNDTKTILIRGGENGGSVITITRRYSTP